MKITAQTTDEQIMAPVEAARQEMAKWLIEDKGADAESIASRANGIAVAEGRAQARWEYRNALADEATDEQIKAHFFRLLTNHPDDKWSGRGNDARRAKADGFREEAARLVRGF